MKEKPPSKRTRVVRANKRGAYDKGTIYKIIDEAVLCHVACIHDGHPIVIPTFCWRYDDSIYWHGSRKSRALLASKGYEVCLTVSQIDALVLARSAFHHSANYSSVVVYGEAQIIDDWKEKLKHFQYFIEKIFPGRWDKLRPVNEQEIKATTVLSLSLNEASAKIRTGQTVDDEDDYSWPVWAGIIPINSSAGVPEQCPRQRDSENNFANLELPIINNTLFEK